MDEEQGNQKLNICGEFVSLGEIGYYWTEWRVLGSVAQVFFCTLDQTLLKSPIQ